MTDKILVIRSEIEALNDKLIEIYSSLALENEGKNSNIKDTLWMIEGNETIFDAVAAVQEEISALLDKAAISQDEPVSPDFFKLDDGSEYWFECPDDEAIIGDLSNVKVDTEYDVWASHTYRQTYRVTKLPDEKDDDTEVELVSSQRSYYTSPPADKQDAERYRWTKRKLLTECTPEELDEQIDAEMQKDK